MSVEDDLRAGIELQRRVEEVAVELLGEAIAWINGTAEPEHGTGRGANVRFLGCQALGCARQRVADERRELAE